MLRASQNTDLVQLRKLAIFAFNFPTLLPVEQSGAGSEDGADGGSDAAEAAIKSPPESLAGNRQQMLDVESDSEGEHSAAMLAAARLQLPESPSPPMTQPRQQQQHRAASAQTSASLPPIAGVATGASIGSSTLRPRPSSAQSVRAAYAFAPSPSVRQDCLQCHCPNVC